MLTTPTLLHLIAAMNPSRAPLMLFVTVARQIDLVECQDAISKGTFGDRGYSNVHRKP